MKHHWKYVSKRLALLLMVLFVGTFTLTGCGSGGGSDDYDAPEGQPSTNLPGQVDNILVDADWLEDRIDAGLVNKQSQENVIILQQKNYDDGHISGALELGSTGIDRIEGPILSGNMAYDGETMDSVLNSLGIKKGSTIVFMGNNSERIYFMFRYWGFPKDQLKILNGGLNAWTTAGNTLTSVRTQPIPNEGEYKISISDFEGGLNEDVRASLGEMIEGVEDGTLIPFATYSATFSSTPTVWGTLTNDTGVFGYAGDPDKFVLFQGEIEGQVVDDTLVSPDRTRNLYNSDGSYKTAADMRVELERILGSANWEAVKAGDKAIATFCRAGNLAANGFTPIEVVLGTEIDVMLYDGSWSQWGSLTQDSAAIPAGKLWAVPDSFWDQYEYAPNELTPVIYNAIDAVAEVPDNLEPPHFYEVFNENTDEFEFVDVEADDAQYRKEGPQSAPDAVSIPGSSGC